MLAWNPVAFATLGNNSPHESRGRRVSGRLRTDRSATFYATPSGGGDPVCFRPLNPDWNADPDAPEPEVKVLGADIRLRFVVDYIFDGPNVLREYGVLRFSGCHKYRLGSTNDEGWYRGQCRFSRLAPQVGRVLRDRW
jgi:hypothetical protein